MIEERFIEEKEKKTLEKYIADIGGELEIPNDYDVFEKPTPTSKEEAILIEEYKAKIDSFPYSSIDRDILTEQYGDIAIKNNYDALLYVVKTYQVVQFP